MVLRVLFSVADALIARWRSVCDVAGIATMSVVSVVMPASWRRVPRGEFIRQFAAIGTEGAGFLLLAAVIVGVAMFMQGQVWLEHLGQEGTVRPLLIKLMIREVGPLLTMVILIGRNGSACTAELGEMSVSGEVSLLRSQGIDPFVFLVYPRVSAMSVAGLCLSILFIASAFMGAYLFAACVGLARIDAFEHARRILEQVGPVEVINVLVKAVLPGLVAGAICTRQGLGVARAADIPSAVRRAHERSLAAVCVIDASVSVLSYAIM